jgi:hypothetical protein
MDDDAFKAAVDHHTEFCMDDVEQQLMAHGDPEMLAAFRRNWGKVEAVLRERNAAAMRLAFAQHEAREATRH